MSCVKNQYLSKVSRLAAEKKFLQLLLSMTSDKEDIQEVKDMLKGLKKMVPNQSGRKICKGLGSIETQDFPLAARLMEISDWEILNCCE